MGRLTLWGTILVTVLVMFGVLLIHALVIPAEFAALSGVMILILGIAVGVVLWRHLIQPAQRSAAILTSQATQLQQEIAVQQQTAVTLRQQTDQYQLLFQFASDIVYILNMAGYVTFVNQAVEDIVGYHPADVVGRPFAEFIGDADVQRLWEKLGRDGFTNYEFSLENRAGKLITLEVNGHVMVQDGQPTAVLGIARDITARKEEQAALQQARDAAEKDRQAKTSFLTNMGHELRTPLSIILGYADILGKQARATDYAEYALLTDKIKRAGQQLRDTINDILEMTEIETGQMSFILEQVEIMTLAQRAVDNTQTAVDANNNDLLLLVPPDIGQMLTDQRKVQRALENLLNNAAKFTENGAITLSIFREAQIDQEWVCLQVSDTGIGIAPDQHELIFDAFKQADNSFTRGYSGAGLGLAITRHICQALGGRIELASELGAGATFTIYLPVAVTAVDAMYVHRASNPNP